MSLVPERTVRLGGRRLTRKAQVDADDTIREYTSESATSGSNLPPMFDSDRFVPESQSRSQSPASDGSSISSADKEDARAPWILAACSGRV